MDTTCNLSNRRSRIPGIKKKKHSHVNQKLTTVSTKTPLSLLVADSGWACVATPYKIASSIVVLRPLHSTSTTKG